MDFSDDFVNLPFSHKNAQINTTISFKVLIQDYEVFYSRLKRLLSKRLEPIFHIPVVSSQPLKFFKLLANEKNLSRT